MTVTPQEYFSFNQELSPFHNDQWRKGGMTSNGLRRAGEVINHFRGPGRQNIIPNATNDADMTTTNPSFKEPVSSIGWLQTNGLGQVSSGPSGPGTIQKGNVEFRVPAVTSEAQQGYVIQNEKRSQFVDYRNTDPSLVENLRQNPLSIYAVQQARYKPVPPFFANIYPDSYETYKTEPVVPVSDDTKILAIDGSPQVNILGLAQQNPLMGITTGIPNTEPTIMGKVYGGNDDADAKPLADQLYDQVWTDNQLKRNRENFGNSNHCKNKALSEFAQGYNVSPQIVEGKKIEWVGNGMHGVTNLPWGPIKVTGNPRTQQGGVWQRSNVFPTVNTPFGYQNSSKIILKGANVKLPPKPFRNPYKDGLPGSLVAS